MAVFNYIKKEIDAKIVYYGPGISGKTTNLQFIHQHLKAEQRGKMVSLQTDEDRTLFFDFLPIELESVRGFKTRFHLYTVPGQVYYGATRRAVLTGADGVIFVADSQDDRMEDNLFSWKDLEDNLRYYGKKIETIPLIIQYNKRDLPNVLPVEELNQKINRLHAPCLESVAVLGKGVFETLTMVCRMVLKAIEDGVDARRSSIIPDSAVKGLAARTLKAEKGMARPEPALPQASLNVPPAKSLRLEKDALKPQPSPIAAGAKPLRLAQDSSAPVFTTPLAAEIKPAAKSLGVGKGTPAAVSAQLTSQAVPVSKAAPSIKEIPIPPPQRPMQMPREPVAMTDEEKKKPEGRTLFSRMFEKKKYESIPKPAEQPVIKATVTKEKLRILSCGQARISPPSGLEIPLTIELDGFGKSVSVNLKINLDQSNSKVDS